VKKSYILIKTEVFERNFEKLIPQNKREDIIRRINNLTLNPYVGKPLHYNFLRELKLDKLRIYFFIYDDQFIVLMANISNKKTQKTTIAMLKEEKELFMTYVQQYLNNLKNFR
jgi:hypothetical protein